MLIALSSATPPNADLSPPWTSLPTILLALLSLAAPVSSFVVNGNLQLSISSRMHFSRGSDDDDSVSGTPSAIPANVSKPKVVVFDLDGCLWEPEMYEINWLYGGNGAPFSECPEDGTLLTCGGEPVRLLGDTREVMAEIHASSEWDGVAIGISSRTDEPEWAQELLQKFVIREDGGHGNGRVYLQDLFEGGPVEIAKDNKVMHFQRIAGSLGVSFGDILFFDNESGNCREVAKMGVTVAYCPEGITRQIWEVALEVFPQTGGQVVGIDVFGYNTLEGAERFY